MANSKLQEELVQETIMPEEFLSHEVNWKLGSNNRRKLLTIQMTLSDSSELRVKYEPGVDFITAFIQIITAKRKVFNGY